MRFSNVDKHVNPDEMPVKLCNYVDVYKSDRIVSNMEFMSATARVDEVERFLLQVGDVLITKDSETWNDIGVSALVESTADDLVCGYHLALLRPSTSTVMGPYLHWALQVPDIQYQLHIEAKGVTRFGLSQNAIASMLLPIPPLSEQAAIIRHLDEADTRIQSYIRAKKRLIELLTEQKQAIIDQAVTHGLDPNVPMKPSGVEWLGDVPVHWEVQKLRNIIKPVTLRNRPDLPLLSVVRERGVILRDIHDRDENHNFIPDDLTNYKVVRSGQFAMNKMKAWQGSYGVSQHEGIVSPAYFVFDVYEVRGDFFNAAIRSKAYVPFFSQASDGIRVGQWDLSQVRLREIVFCVPPLDEQTTIVRHIGRTTADIDNAIDRTRHQIELIQEYRTRLIADVVTGKLDVRGAVSDEMDI